MKTKSKTVLVLEDALPRIKRFAKDLGEEYTVYFAKTVEEAVSLYKEHDPGILFLDHALGNKETGIDFVRTLPIEPMPMPSILLHSCDPIGAKKMFQELRERGYYSVYNSAYPCLLAETILGAARFLTRVYKSNEEIDTKAVSTNSKD